MSTKEIVVKILEVLDREAGHDMDVIIGENVDKDSDGGTLYLDKSRF